MEEAFREFQIFVKPVGAVCNLGCSYCYYLEKKLLYQENSDFLMSGDVLEKYIIQHISATTEKLITFSWHGGEPLLAGIDFFRRAVELQKHYKPEGSRIVNGIQTNGTLLDEKWCRFLSEENFVVGVSMDGPAALHNRFRIYRDGKKSFDKVLKGFNLLKSHGLLPEILCVVNAENVDGPKDVYDFFKSLEAKYIAFLPLVEKSVESATGVTEKSVSAEKFGEFLCTVFDEWVENDIGRIKIQIFEEAVRTAFNLDHTLCIFKKNCGGVPVVEYTGDFYCCDHYVNSSHLLGNIKDHSLADLLDSNKQKEFGSIKSQTLPNYCLNCEVLSMCNGECPKNRFISSPDGEPGLNYLCPGYKIFFNHCRPFVDAIAEAWKNQ
jgi:uncharacterized protein